MRLTSVGRYKIIKIYIMTSNTKGYLIALIMMPFVYALLRATGLYEWMSSMLACIMSLLTWMFIRIKFDK